MRDWSSLAPDLIQHVGDLLLDTSDVDGYMDMRAVCRDWRSAVADPRAHGAADLRFCPRQWVMLDDDDNFDEGCLFVNVSTGRFFRRRLPLLRTGGHVLAGASDGLLVLADSRNPQACCVLNPYTGHTIRFAAPIGNLRTGRTSGTFAVAAKPDPMLLFANTGAVYGMPQAWLAHPATKIFYCIPRDDRSTRHMAATVAYAGQIYMAYNDGSVYTRVGSSEAEPHGHDKLIIAAGKAGKGTEAIFLVESAGDLLLVLRQRWRCNFRVFRVDVEMKALEPAASIGGRALFLGRRCLSVAADKFMNIEGDCIYYAASWCNRPDSDDRSMYRFTIRDGWETLLTGSMDPKICHKESVSEERPLCIARVFLAYCMNLPDFKAQLML